MQFSLSDVTSCSLRLHLKWYIFSERNEFHPSVMLVTSYSIKSYWSRWVYDIWSYGPAVISRHVKHELIEVWTDCTHGAGREEMLVSLFLSLMWLQTLWTVRAVKTSISSVWVSAAACGLHERCCKCSERWAMMMMMMVSLIIEDYLDDSFWASMLVKYLTLNRESGQ